MLTHQYRLTFGQSGEKYSCCDWRVTEIPTNIPPDVVRVGISSQCITTIKANVFSQLSQCTHLGLKNVISNIEPGAFNGLTNLNRLSLSYNRLERLYKDTFVGIYNCERLDLHSNQISEIEPGSFDGLSNLKFLRLQNNRLTILRSGTFLGLSKCISVWLLWNLISEIEVGSFNGLSAPLFLSIHSNKLERLHRNMFYGLTNCTRLDLLRNQIRVIEPGSFNVLRNLEELNLPSNSLTTLREGTFQRLLSARILSFHSRMMHLLGVSVFWRVYLLGVCLLGDLPSGGICPLEGICLLRTCLLTGMDRSPPTVNRMPPVKN